MLLELEMFALKKNGTAPPDPSYSSTYCSLFKCVKAVNLSKETNYSNLLQRVQNTCHYILGWTDVFTLLFWMSARMKYKFMISTESPRYWGLSNALRYCCLARRSPKSIILDRFQSCILKYLQSLVLNSNRKTPSMSLTAMTAADYEYWWSYERVFLTATSLHK